MNSMWPDVPFIVDGETTFSDAGVNPIINALRDRTDYLRSISNTTASKNGYTITDIGFGADCPQGTLVAYNPATGRYTPAKAVWDTAISDNNGLRPGMESYVKGVVISDPTADSTATILCEGWIADEMICSRLIPSKQAGNYYLMADGTLSKDTDTNAPTVFCCTYTTSGKLYVSPKEPIAFGHTHTGITIDGEFFEKPTQVMNLPETAKAAYDLNSNAALKSLLTASKDSALLIGNGVLLNKGTWGFDTNAGYLYTNFAVHVDDVYTIYGVTPILGDTSIVRNIVVDPADKLLNVSSYNNVAYLSTKFPTLTTTDMTATCVSNITNEGVAFAPVINELRAGAGINLYRNEYPGSYTIASSAVSDTIIDMNIVNIDGAVLGGDSTGTYITMPAGTYSALTGTMRIPAHNISELRVLPALFVRGTGGVLPAFSINMTVQPVPTAAESYKPLANTFVYNTAVQTNTSNDNIYRIDINNIDSANISAVSNAFVVLRISATPTVAVSIMSAGIYLTK